MQIMLQHPFLRPGLPVAGLLWLGLGAAMAAIAVQPGGNGAAAAGLPLAIGVLTLFVAAVVASFSLRYMRADRDAARFFVTLGGLAAAVLIFLFTDTLPVLAVAWIASGQLLATLVGHSGGWTEAAAAARRARLSFLAGDAALVAALAILGWHGGSVQISAVLATAATLPPPLAVTVGLLLVVAASVRCALPPAAGWLLSSMTAPTPVSALMHAGFVNAGGFLLIRFAPVLEAAPAARGAAVLIGLCGAIYGVGIMMVRPDVKRALAGSTVSQMGFMIMSCGLGAYAAALWHIIAHGLFKAWLFLGSGSTIGMKARPVQTLSPLSSLAIAAATTGCAMALVLSGEGDASLVPLLLGLATAAATLVSFVGGKAPLKTRLWLVLGLAALIAFHGAGLALAQRAVGPDAAALVPGWALLLLLIAFLAAWVAQQRRLAAGRSLPLPLYVHLINAGALPPAAKGAKP